YLLDRRCLIMNATQQPTLSGDYYPFLERAKETLDIKVKSPWPGQVKRQQELKDRYGSEHILVRKAREGVACRLICLESESYRDFFRKANDVMAESPHFEEAQKMIAEFQKAGGQVRRISGALNPEVSFVVADRAIALVFVAAWIEATPRGFCYEPFPTTDPKLIDFLSNAFDLCWKTI
ncbi:MAG: hypothetical protein ACREYF_27520, partial [Gammaproteobacteria bacterium]